MIGIYVVVDRVSLSHRAIRPMAMHGVDEAARAVVELPLVTAERMAQYRQLARDHGIPIVQIPTGPSVNINGGYVSSLYPAHDRFFPTQDAAKAAL